MVLYKKEKKLSGTYSPPYRSYIFVVSLIRSTAHISTYVQPLDSLNYFFAYSYSFTNQFIFVALLYFLYLKSDIVPLMHL